MKLYQITIKPLSAFGTPLVGDTLFGQLCWAVVHCFGQQRLQELLQGYAEQSPFMVVSDAFPHNYIPLPTLPSAFWQWESNVDRQAERKKLKKLAYLPVSEVNKPLNQWQELAYLKAQQEKEHSQKKVVSKQTYIQFHNTIDRQTQTTGTGQFAPFTTSQVMFKPDSLFDLYFVLDEVRLSYPEALQLFEYIGQFGFGRDASTGMGKFEVQNKECIQAVDFSRESANAYLTLANSAPQHLGLDKTHSFYQITTRFGRHGGEFALHSSPFKKPIILAKTGAIFTPTQWQERLFLGNGLTQVSSQQPNAVHQGYAPVIPVMLDFDLEKKD
ncbi:RAMP superfamily CRISPR-associated protein [Gallibacterium melopsittaci]|uniref:CRISPR system Cms protein Csm4 n=1 Tax=Gallibacterium melopsittaci TaxID=516063 RepID=A0ABV6HV56_9PAST